MQKIVQFRDRQKIPHTDLNNIQAHAQATFDDLVRDAITDQPRFAGFQVTANGTTSVDVAAGRYFKDGSVYFSDAVVTKSLLTELPAVTKKIVSIVVWGQTVDTDTEPREFLVDPVTEETESQAVSMTSARHAEVDTVAGVESADPQRGALGSNVLLVADVTLTPTGIESITRADGYVVPSTETNQAGIGALEAWRAATSPAIDALSATVAGLVEASGGRAGFDDLLAIGSDIAYIREKLDLPDAWTQYGADYYGDEAETDTLYAGYDAKVDDGLHFPATEASQALSLFNPTDPLVYKTAGDFCLPSFTDEQVLKTTGYTATIVIAHQGYTWEYRRLAWPAWRWWYGRRRLWNRGWYIRNWKRFHGPAWAWRLYRSARAGYWVKKPVKVYKKLASTTNLSGSLTAQTFQASRSMWLSAVGLYLTTVAATGDVEVMITEVTENGKPDLDSVLATTTVAQTDLKAGRTETRVPVGPVWLEAGKRYTLALVTQGAHAAAVVNDGSRYTAGSLFVGRSDGSMDVHDTNKDLEFALYAAAFDRPRTEVQLNNVSLTGGMTDLDINTEIVQPEGTTMMVEAQVAGQWVPLSEVGHLTTKPDQIGLRLVFVGTRDVAPAIQLGADTIITSRDNDSLVHVSTERTLLAPSSDIRVIVDMDGWDTVSAGHTVQVDLIKPGDIIEASVGVTEQILIDDEGDVITRQIHSFTPAAISAYRIKISGAKTAGAEPYVVASRTDVAM